MKLQINAGDKNASNKRDATYGDKFIIPLNFEMLDSAISYYQSRLGNRLYVTKLHLVIIIKLSYQWE